MFVVEGLERTILFFCSQPTAPISEEKSKKHFLFGPLANNLEVLHV